LAGLAGNKLQVKYLFQQFLEMKTFTLSSSKNYLPGVYVCKTRPKLFLKCSKRSGRTKRPSGTTSCLYSFECI